MTRTGSESHSMSGLGGFVCSVGGRASWSNEATIFATPASPAAGSRWPMLVDSTASDERMDLVSTAWNLAQPRKDQDDDAFAATVTIGVGRERLRATIGSYGSGAG